MTWRAPPQHGQNLVLRLYHHLLMRQMIELEDATGAALVRPRDLQGRIGFLLLRLILGERSFQVLQRERQLIVANACAPGMGIDLEVRVLS
jgi:hypothetical protein